MIREPAVAGMFYPYDRDELLDMIKAFWNEAKYEEIDNIRAIISPHAGYIYSGIVAASAFKTLRTCKCKEFVLLGPSHYYYFPNAVTSSFEEWLTPLGAASQSPLPGLPVLNEPFLKEHSLEVQLPFLQYAFREIKIYPALFGDLREAERISRLIENLELPIIVSSDLSHYLPYEEAVSRDRRTIDLIVNLDINGFAKYGDACGKEAIRALMHIAKRNNWKAKLVDYRNSGDTAGDKSAVVGYASIAFYEG